MDLVERNSQNTNRHPWEISRAFSIIGLLRDEPYNTVFADIGSGDMYFVNILKDLTNKEISAIDINYEQPLKVDNINLYNKINQVEENSVDYVILMDVLEHVDDEKHFLSEILKILKDNGKILITVPAHNFLFSSHDVFLRHYRRYNITSLTKLLSQNNITIRKKFYFYSILFLFRCVGIVADKLLKRNKSSEGIGNWKYKCDSIITKAIVFLLNFDFKINLFLSRFNILFMGLSICVICQKKSSS